MGIFTTQKKAERLKKILTLAMGKGGRCLSKQYINNETKLKFMCSQGHIWHSTPSNFLQGKWCPKCAITKNANSKRLSLSDVNKWARRKGGKCLAKVYVNCVTKLEWSCKKKHVWKAVPSSIQSGSWCPHCSGHTRVTVRMMDKIARRNGGKLLSKSFKTTQSKVKWICNEGHIWRATVGSVRQGSWCSKCAHVDHGNRLRLNIAAAAKEAKKYGGKCLSSKYLSSFAKLKWKCKRGHVFKKELVAVRVGQWCPDCAQGKGERICRRAFEALLGAKFSKTRPKWLVNSRGNQMELDGYNEKMKLAFEHQGGQHFESDRWYIKSKKVLAQRKLDDKRKKLLCAERGITLIQVPEIPRLLPVADCINFIRKQMKSIGISYRTFDEALIYEGFTDDHDSVHFQQIKQIVEERGGKLFSKAYLGARIKVLVQCKHKHKWSIAPEKIKSGRWCPACKLAKLGESRKTIEDMNILAKSKDGVCLSKKYININTNLKWKCDKGHIWQSTPASVRINWCPECGKERVRKALAYTIGDMVKLAKKRGGLCLSQKYKNTKSKLKWVCQQGHRWEAFPSNVLRGHWCQRCGNQRRKSYS